MNVFLLGDFLSNNGPANANKKIYESLSNQVVAVYSQEQSYSRRMMEMCQGIVKTDVLLICSASKINYYAILLAKLMHKKIVYIMHGYGSNEAKMNEEIDQNQIKKIIKYERFVFEKVDRIVCVSKHAMENMGKQVAKIKGKLDYINNVVEADVDSFPQNNMKEDYIVSVGGGIKLKNNLKVAEAVERINVELGEKYKYVVVGPKSKDGVKIDQKECVQYIEYMPHEELLHMMASCMLYVQNSYNETFGLAVIEALFAGANLLISQYVGCKNLMKDLQDTDIIYDVDDVDEIVAKMKYILQNGNSSRLKNSFCREKVSKEYLAKRLMDIIQSI